MSADDNRWPRIREVMRRARRKYEVNGRRGTGGKIGKREYFDTKEDAKKRADELRAEVKKKGVESLSLTTPQRVMAEECIKRLAVRGRSLKDATDFYLKHLEVTAKSIKWRDFVEQLGPKRRAMALVIGMSKTFATDFGNSMRRLGTGSLRKLQRPILINFCGNSR